MNEAICYRWHDTKTNKVYVGYHKINQMKLHGFYEDGYISSSKTFNEEYSKRPYDFVRGIYARGTCKEMLWLENRILKFADAKRSPWFYNQTNGDDKFICKHHTEESRKKMSESSKGNQSGRGYRHTEEARRKLSDAHKGKHHTEETRKKMSEARSGVNAPFLGKHHSESTRDGMSKSRKGKPWSVARRRAYRMRDNAND